MECCFKKIYTVSEMGQDNTKVIVDDQYGNMGFQFLSKWVTLDDTEGPLSTLVSKILVFSEFTTNFWMHFCNIITDKNAGGISCIRIFTRVASRLKGGIKRQCGCRQRQFPVLSLISPLESLQALRQGQQKA